MIAVTSLTLHYFTMIYSVLLLLLLLPAAASLSSSPFPSATAARRFSKIYAFGDSYTDTGNTHSAAGPYSFGYVSSPPYGTTYFHRSTNRYSDGRLVIDFLTAALSLPFLPPYLTVARNPSWALHGVNFAVAGSTAIEHEFYERNNITVDVTPQSLMTQLGWFQKHAEAAGKGAGIDEALFWVGEIGANDYAYISLSSVSPSLVQDLAIRKVFSFLCFPRIQVIVSNGRAKSEVNCNLVHIYHKEKKKMSANVGHPINTGIHNGIDRLTSRMHK